MRRGLGQGVAVQHHPRAPAFGADHLGRRGEARHDDDGGDAGERGVPRHRLRVVARRHGDDAAPPRPRPGRAMRLAAPRSLNAPVAWSVSSFRKTRQPAARETASDGTVGVRSTAPRMRSAAARTSASPIMPPGRRERRRQRKLDVGDLVGAGAAGRRNLHAVADLPADQRLGERRGERDGPRLHVGLVRADDAVGLLLLRLLVDDRDAGAELHLVAGQLGDVDHLDGGDDRLQLRDAALDEGLPLARGVVLGVLRQVAMGARLRDRRG